MNSSSQPSADTASTPLSSTPALILSGLAGQEAVPAWVHSWAAAGAARWVPAQELVEAAGGTLAASGVRIIWLYSPPWASPGIEPLTLDAWMALQRQVMRLRRLSPGSWLLVNVQQVNPADLARSLEVPVEELNESMGTAAQSADVDVDQSLLLARLFDWSAPQAWDLFDALEAASWVGPGQAQPLLREQLPVPGAAALEALQRQLERATRLPALEAEQVARQAQWQQREAELEAALDQVRQAAAASAAEMAQAQADAQAQAADLAAERDDARRQLDASQQQLKEAKEEGELLLLQLHQVQEELEQLFLKSKDQETSAANALSEAAAALAKAHSEHAAQLAAHQNEKAQALAKAQADAQAQAADLAAERDDARRQLDASQQHLQEAKEEGELLLLQLHQVQEELEQLFLKSKDQETSAANALSEAAAALAKAHSEHAAQVAALQNEKAQALAKAQADAQAALERAQAERYAAVDKAVAEGKAARDKAIAEGKAAQDKAIAEGKAAHDKAIADGKAELEKATAEARAALEKAKAAADKDIAQAQAQAADRANERDEARRQLDASQQQLKDAQEEGELLLLQLHQVQEELEQIFLDGKDKEASAARAQAQSRSEIDTLKSELSAQAGKLKAAELKKTELTDALDRTRATLAICQQDIEVIQKESRALQSRLEAENSGLQSTLTQAQAELDELRTQHETEVGKQADQHAQVLAELHSAELTLRQQRDQLMLELHRAHEEMDNAEQARHSLLAERTSLEGELAQARELLNTRVAEHRAHHHSILLELHRAHEDMETAESRHQQSVKELQQELAMSRQRMGRLKQRLGPKMAFMEVEVAGFDTKAAVPWVDWMVRDLQIGDGEEADVLIRTSVSSTGLGVEPRGVDADTAFSRGALFPALLARTRNPEQLALFRQISTKSWRHLTKAVAAISASLTDPHNAVELPGQLARDPWRNALSTLDQDLGRLPEVFRFDGVSLAKELVAERYEHLWLKFEGAAYGAAAMPAFSLRLAAVTGAANGFSVLPQLEIPLLPDGSPPFEGWYQVKSDALGPRFELRADLERRAFDQRVWSALPGPAQTMLLSLIAAMPAALRDLQRPGLRLSRPAEDWIALMEDMIAVMRQALAQPRMAAGQGPALRAGSALSQATGTPVATRAATAQAAAAPRVQVLQAAALSPEFQAIPSPQKTAKTPKPSRSKSPSAPKASAQIAPKASASTPVVRATKKVSSNKSDAPKSTYPTKSDETVTTSAKTATRTRKKAG